MCVLGEGVIMVSCGSACEGLFMAIDSGFLHVYLWDDRIGGSWQMIGNERIVRRRDYLKDW